MSCGCLKKKDSKEQEVRLLAKRYHEKTGNPVVFYKCSDYDFSELQNFNPDGKTIIEYFM